MEPDQNTGIYRVIELAARVVVGLVFLLYGLDKIAHPDDFARAIANYRLLPEALVNLVAVTLPWIELFCGLLLLAGQWVRSAALVSAFLLSVFVIAVSITLARGLDINCGCFSSAPSSEGRIGLLTLLRDFTILPIALFVLIADRGDFSLGKFALKPAQSA